MPAARAALRWGWILCAACGLVLSCSSEPRGPRVTVDGTLTEVIDGSTAKVDIGGATRTVKLYGIESPQINERFGRFGAQYLDANLRGQAVQLVGPPGAGEDFTSATFLDSDGNDVQLRLLALGLAWTVEENFPNKNRYLQEQTSAKQNRAGIWAVTQSVPPEGLGRALTADANDRPLGRWRPAESSLDGDMAELAEEILSIGYLAGHDKATGEGGVMVYAEAKTQEGLNLVVSGHGHEAMLVDMRGKLIHRWQYDWKQVMPKWVRPAAQYGVGHEFWRRVHPFPNGDLLAIYENLGLVKIDASSKLVWAHIDTCHHDLDIDARGHIFVLTRRLKAIEPIAARGNVINDSITELAPDGKPIRTINIVDCFLNSPFADQMNRLELSFDPMHVNSIQLLHGQDGVFCEGRALISVRELDLISVVDLADETIVWTLAGSWVRQHDPALLDSGRILLFDNLGHNGHSRVLEIEPMSGEIVWSYAPADSSSFFTGDCGLSHRLANGNTLCVESNRGRAIEVDPAGTIVWEYHNPHRAGEQDELIATLLDVMRLPSDYADAWANGGWVPTE